MQPWLWLFFSVKLAALWSSSALVQTPDSKTLLTNHAVEISCEANTLSKTALIYWLRQRRESKDKRFEFLVSWNPSKGNAVYGEGVKKEHTIVFSHLSRSILNLTRLKLEDSGTYFCMMIGSPQLIFGKGTELRVVDVLPTTAQPKTTVFKKKPCQTPKLKAQKGMTCGLITLSLLVASILVLLVSLSVAVHFHCLRRKARIRFMKQFYK
ncbi:T-cell surface glycoprotein CD8 beta chain [Arvicola amphibius]|uniref:T-cell surface glycoprotein CD8 beta chain n=1 Tax=Arvicola amphibius TaxID=1047088 RepID=UPI0018E2B408|nr:T-cell surface glycoprotein CD8 beta chain [Arvicola amphibius]